MRLTDIVKPESIKVPLESTEKQAAIFELAQVLVEHTGIADGAVLRDAIWQRELTRTTGIGYGIAIPHGKCQGVDQLHMAIGRASEPIPFAAIDGKPVELIFLLASPIDQTGPHIQALASISRMLTDEKVREAIRLAEDSAALYKFIQEYEAASTAR